MENKEWQVMSCGGTQVREAAAASHYILNPFLSVSYPTNTNVDSPYFTDTESVPHIHARDSDGCIKGLWRHSNYYSPEPLPRCEYFAAAKIIYLVCALIYQQCC